MRQHGFDNWVYTLVSYYTIKHRDHTLEYVALVARGLLVYSSYALL